MAENIRPTPKEIQIHQAFFDRYKAVSAYIRASGSEYFPYLRPFLEAVNTYGLVVIPSTARYDQDIGSVRRNVHHPPFGLDLNTLSPNVQLVLGLQTVYRPTKMDSALALMSGIRMRQSGPQARLYVLDNFPEEVATVEAAAANLFFIGHLTDALLRKKYPLEKDQKSPEFTEQVREAAEIAGGYVKGLSDERRALLSQYVRSIGEFDGVGVIDFAQKFVDYQVELAKVPGLIEPGSFRMRPEDPDKTPKAAVDTKTEYLHCSDRNLPLIVAGILPSLPWKEHGRNRWNRDYQLFGRYEVAEAGLRVDFRLDTTHFPGKYHFFDTIEISQDTEQARQQIIFGQEVNKRKQAEEVQKASANPAYLDSIFHRAGFVFPIVAAGNFDFSGSARPYLEQLANDKGTKADVRVVLKDILDLASQRQLWTVETYRRRN